MGADAAEHAQHVLAAIVSTFWFARAVLFQISIQIRRK
jgi:hypothetical protein